MSEGITLKFVRLFLLFSLLAGKCFAQQTPAEKAFQAYMNQRLITGGLSSAEAQTVNRALEAIDNGATNLPSKLFILDGDTVWVREVQPARSTLAQITRSANIEIDDGIKIGTNWSTRVGRTDIVVKRIRVRPGKIGLVIAGVGGAAALCSHVGMCEVPVTRGDEADIDPHDIQMIEIVIE